MIVITAATGQLGRLVIDKLLESIPATQIVAAVRDISKGSDIASRGVRLRLADYTKPETLVPAFEGADKLLLISSNAIGERVSQHRAAIEAAVKAKVELVVYTSILRADTSPLGLALEHMETERMLAASGLPHVVLRNGWYTENYAASVPAALAHGVLLGSAKQGRISSAARADYAAAAAAVLLRGDQAGRVYELAGDASYTLSEFAAEIARQSGKPVDYKDLPEADFGAALTGFGLPGPVAAMLADSDVGVSRGGLFDDGGQLAALIGRPTTPMSATIAASIVAATRPK